MAFSLVSPHYPLFFLTTRGAHDRHGPPSMYHLCVTEAGGVRAFILKDGGQVPDSLAAPTPTLGLVDTLSSPILGALHPTWLVAGPVSSPLPMLPLLSSRDRS